MTTHVQTTFECDICGLKYVRKWDDQFGGTPDHKLPRAWRQIGLTTVCHRHSIQADTTEIRIGCTDLEAGFIQEEIEQCFVEPDGPHKTTETSKGNQP